MTDIDPENQGFYRATIFLRELAKKGVTHIVISPGSRSTPLVMAAAALPAFEKHIILDERSAAFLALGIGKATHQPAALICTSGTAVANYYPAVIEARKCGVPILLLTADRPESLHGTGANQTINQHKIFGDYPVLFYDIGEPKMNEKNINRMGELAARVHQQSRSDQGPVHINFPFSKPLEPNGDFLHQIKQENEKLNFALSEKSSEEKNSNYHFNDEILHDINESERPLVIIGQLAARTNPDSVFQLANSLNAPILSEQDIPGPKFSIQGFEGFLRQNEKQKMLEPDFILRFGQQPASKSLLQAIKSWRPARHLHISDTEWKSNIANTTTDFLEWNGQQFDTGNFSPKDGNWLKKWKQAEKDYFVTADRLLEQQRALTDGHIYHHFAPEIPEEWTVFVSNSFPARDQSMFGRWNMLKKFTNRGASGIDGITSTAMGISIGLRQPCILFTGDLAFLHDSNALLNAKELTQPVVVIIINNKGGSIFRMLPIADHRDYFKTYFETPQMIDISKIAAAHDINYRAVEKKAELNKINLKEYQNAGLHIVECKTDPDASMEARHKLWGNNH